MSCVTQNGATGATGESTARAGTTVICSRALPRPKSTPGPSDWAALAFSPTSADFYRVTNAGKSPHAVLEHFSYSAGRYRLEEYPTRTSFAGGHFRAELIGPARLGPVLVIDSLEIDAKVSLGSSDSKAVLHMRARDVGRLADVEREREGEIEVVPEEQIEIRRRLVVLLERGTSFFMKLEVLHGCAAEALSSWDSEP